MTTTISALAPDGRPLQIAVDGTAASGKGTLAKRLAKTYGLAYLDTGAIYRAAAYRLRESGDAPDDVNAAVKSARLVTENMPDRDVLYSEGIGKIASVISAYPEVRVALLDFQRHVAESEQGAVLDGRDIGTVICPHAHLKFFITASLEARAQRRFRQLQSSGDTVMLADVSEDLQRRDARDSNRASCPLIKAVDAVSIDSTHMNADQVFQLAVEYVQKLAP